MAFEILGPIRNIYIALHRDTDSAPTRFSATTTDYDRILLRPSSYPSCIVPGHHPGLTPHIRGDSAFTTFVHIVHNNTVPDPALLSSSETPSSCTPPSFHVVKSLTAESPLDNFHPADRTAIGSLRNPVTSPDPAIADAIRDVTSGITIFHPAPETLASFPLSSPAAITLRHNPDLLMPSDPPSFLSSASSNPVLDNILSIGPLTSSLSPITRFDLSPSFPESHRSVMVTAHPSASPGPTSAPDSGATAEDDGIPKPGLCKGREVPNPPSVNSAIHARSP
ncbi:hypothetical protein EDB92DRAFT_1871599 [Lactarius akahatsu]|uniref:Uncharacterized protein n=1 Tax=Lactarius akahatsu TaxID=416441 RepID=A0AAD4LCH8_9AGAM|nr:hypothetical protein EDB92DRAFT_1871599 [Lactarius akahatsu]